MVIAKEIISDVLVDGVVYGYLVEGLINKAIEKNGEDIRKCGSCSTWEECFCYDVNAGTLSFWYDTKDKSTHTVFIKVKEVSC